MTLADIDDLALLLGDPDVLWVYPHPYTRDEARGWIEWNVGLYRELGFGLWYLTLRDTGEFVGECGLTPQQVEGATEIEVGYHVRPKFWGLGFATEAARACRSFAREVAGLHRLVALIDPRNVASQRVAAKIGLAFEREASVPGKVLRVSEADRRDAAALDQPCRGACRFPDGKTATSASGVGSSTKSHARVVPGSRRTTSPGPTRSA